LGVSLRTGLSSAGKAFSKVSLKTLGKIGVVSITGATFISILRGSNPVTDAMNVIFSKMGLDVPAEIINLGLIVGCICIAVFILTMRRRR
jgi:hypothetical protein